MEKIPTEVLRPGNPPVHSDATLASLTWVATITLQQSRVLLPCQKLIKGFLAICNLLIKSPDELWL